MPYTSQDDLINQITSGKHYRAAGWVPGRYHVPGH
jgi:hypothetical protein